MRFNSSSANDRLASAATFSSTCLTLDAPISALVMPGKRSVHASAICASVWPRAFAISSSARSAASRSGVRFFATQSRPHFCAARLSSGIPSRYLSVNNPLASGLNGITPVPARTVCGSKSHSMRRPSML